MDLVVVIMLTFEILKNALTGSVPKSLKRTYDYDPKLVKKKKCEALSVRVRDKT